MASTLLSSVVGEGSSLPKLSPDLTYPSSLTGGVAYTSISVNPQGSLTEILNLSGKFAINYLVLRNITSETGTIKATRDGVVIWNDTYTLQTIVPLVNARASSQPSGSSRYLCESSFVLEMETLTDTAITLEYNINPIE